MKRLGASGCRPIAHGAFNAVAALFVVLTNPADSYYNVLGPAPIGLIGMLPMLAAAVWLTPAKILKT